MSGYSMDVRWSAEDDGYIAVSPEFEGVSAFGSTASEAVAELEVAIELAVETYAEESWALPTARVHTAYSGQFRVRLPKSLHEWLAVAASRDGVSLNTYVVSTLSEARGSRYAVRIASHVIGDWHDRMAESEHYRFTVSPGDFAVGTPVGSNLFVGGSATVRGDFPTGDVSEQVSVASFVTWSPEFEKVVEANVANLMIEAG